MIYSASAGVTSTPLRYGHNTDAPSISSSPQLRLGVHPSGLAVDIGSHSEEENG